MLSKLGREIIQASSALSTVLFQSLETLFPGQLPLFFNASFSVEAGAHYTALNYSVNAYLGVINTTLKP